MGIIDLQRRFVEIGRIRAGAKSAKGAPTKLDKWRLTSANKPALDAAAEVYGGEVQPWEDGPNLGLWQLFTESNTLRILVPPAAEPYSLWYESWSGGGCDKRCDGERDVLNDAPCSCNPDARTCKPTLRVSLMLPDLPGLGVWRWEGHGINAALELPATLDLLAHATSKGEFLPGYLRLEQRSTRKKGEGTRRFAVPVIDLAQTIGEVTKAIGGPSVPPPPSLTAPQAAPALPAPPEQSGDVCTTAQKRMMYATAKSAGIDRELVPRIAAMVRGVHGSSLSDLPKGDVDRVVRSLEKFGADADASRAKLEAWEQQAEAGTTNNDWGPTPPVPVPGEASS